MEFQRIGPFWLPSALLRDDLLVSRAAATLFFVSTILLLALTPVFLSRVDPRGMSFWMKLPWEILAVIAPIGLFFLFFGMWRYWLRIDNSSKWAKRVWFLVLLLGMWYGSALYYFFAYLPQVMRRLRTEV